MPGKPPVVGITRVDVHVNPTKRPDGDSAHAVKPGRNGVDPWTRVDDPKLQNKSLGSDADLDAILPAPTITVHQASLRAENLPVAYTSLESYGIQSSAELPSADGEGFMLYKNRQYVSVHEGVIVLVGLDPDTGQYRARHSNELVPSGPLLLRDTESGLWHPHNDFNAHTIPLTDASLHAFRTELDVSGVEPGSDGLLRHDGKIYVVLDEKAYQVMQDLDASRPEYKVWRLVNPKDPVATDSANIYRASRSGETRAITRNAQNTWVSILTGLRGGMDRNDPAHANPFNFHRPWLANPGPSGAQPPVVVATTRAQVKRYFTDAKDHHADAFIARFGETGAAEVELKRLQLEFPQLSREIRAWETAYKGNDSAERRRRLAVGDRMRRLYRWQGEEAEKVYRDGRVVGFKLELDLGERGNLALPVFSTRLSSVVSLGLTGSTSKNLGSLFSVFSHIETLEVHRLRGKNNSLLGEIDKLAALKVLEIRETSLWLPSIGLEHFTRLNRLQELSLTNCSIWPRLSVRGMSELRVLRCRSCDLYGLPEGLSDPVSMSRLQVLDLHHNPNLHDAPDVTNMPELRVLDLSRTYMSQLPAGLGLPNGPRRLEVLKFEHSRLAVAPSLGGMTALLEVDLGHTHITRFPEGVTSTIPKTRLSLVYNRITSIPETVELRKGFELEGALISDPVSLRRLIAARRQTGIDFWLRDWQADLGINHWLHNVPQAQHPGKYGLWGSLAIPLNSVMMVKIRKLVRTPEFLVERALLQRRVWSFLELFQKVSLGEQDSLRDIALTEPSPGKMLDRLEEEIKKFDPRGQNQPRHHLPKHPKLG